MVKLIVCLFCAFAVAVATLQLRQQQLELKHRTSTLQKQIENQQATLWNQQLQIAIYTAPNAIRTTVGQDLDLVPESRLPAAAADWMGRPADTKEEQP